MAASVSLVEALTRLPIQHIIMPDLVPFINIIAAWRGSGLFPFKPERVLANVPKPPTELRISNADKLRFESRPGYEALPTPTTPVLGEALTSLLERIKLIPNEDASSQHKDRLQQKVANAA